MATMLRFAAEKISDEISAEMTSDDGEAIDAGVSALTPPVIAVVHAPARSRYDVVAPSPAGA